MSNKIFSETEVSRLLQRAAEIQEKDSTTSYTPGVTFEELQRIATECGISLDALEKAMIQPEQETKLSFLNLVETHERVFEGEIDFDNLDEVMESLGENVRFQTVQQFGRSIKAQVSSGTVFGRLELSARNGRTKLRFRQIPFIAYFAGLHAPLIASFVVGMNFLARGYLVPGLASLVGLLAFGLLLFTYLAKVGKKKARTFVDRMSDQITESLANQASVRERLAQSSAPVSETAAEQTRNSL